MMFKALGRILQGFFNLIMYNISDEYRKNHVIFESRLKKCRECEMLDKKTMQCTVCGCFVKAKTKVQYDVDDDGIAIAYVDPGDSKPRSACPKKRW